MATNLLPSAEGRHWMWLILRHDLPLWIHVSAVVLWHRARLHKTDVTKDEDTGHTGNDIIFACSCQKYEIYKAYEDVA